jgi:succinate dehydrogenase / fumarate reductase cytochrome b subunit
MSAIGSLFRSTIGKKAWMAVTGLVLFAFVAGHMFGNLKLYQGRYAEGPHAGEWKIDVYGEGLRELGAPVLGNGQALWIVRLGLLAAVAIHIWAATALTLQSRAARPVRYAKRKAVEADYAARTMRWGGVIVLLFVLYHLADLTFGNTNPEFVRGAVHHNLVASFSQPWVSIFYVVANLALGLHLFHGLWSFFQSMGWNNPRFNPWRRRFAVVSAVVITAGNVSFPLAVLLGVVR